MGHQDLAVVFKKLLSAAISILFFTACSSIMGETGDPAAAVDPTIEQSNKAEIWDGVLIVNGDFSEDVSGWDVPYGKLEQSIDIYNSAPGGGVAITNDTSGSLGFRTSFGQCVDLRPLLESAPPEIVLTTLVVEAAIKTDSLISEASLNVIFIDDSRCGTGHVGEYVRIDMTGDQDWVTISQPLLMPEKAKSLHVFINAAGLDDTARIYIDDVNFYSPDLD